MLLADLQVSLHRELQTHDCHHSRLSWIAIIRLLGAPRDPSRRSCIARIKCATSCKLLKIMYKLGLSIHALFDKPAGPK